MLKRRLHTALGLSGSLTSHYDGEIGHFCDVDARCAALAAPHNYVVPQVGLCYSAGSAGSGAGVFSRSAPVCWSTTRIDSLTLPRSSWPMTLTLTRSPSLTTSVVLLTRALASCEMWTRPSFEPKKFTKAPNSTVLTTVPS